MRRFVHIRCQAKGLSEDTIIDAAIQGIRGGLLAGKLTRKRPTSVQELLNKMEEYSRSELDHLRRKNEFTASRAKHAPHKEAVGGNPRDRPQRPRKPEGPDYPRQKEINQINPGPPEAVQSSCEAYNSSNRGGRTGRGRGRGGRGGRPSHDPATFYCELHGEGAGDRTKHCPQVVAMKESIVKQSVDNGRAVHHATSFARGEGWQNHNQNMIFPNQWHQVPAPQFAPAPPVQFDQTRQLNIRGDLPPPPPRPAIEAPPESRKSVNTINNGYNVVLAISGGVQPANRIQETAKRIRTKG